MTIAVAGLVRLIGGILVGAAVAGLVGLIGGILVGAWDGFAVMVWHGPHSVPLSDIFYLSLYSVALYGAFGFGLMAAIGAILILFIRVGRYRVDRALLSGIFVGIFVALAVYVFLNVFLPEVANWVEILEFILISVFSGLGLGALSVYILRRNIRNSTLAAACISLVVWVSVLLYGALWINSTVMSGERFWKPASLFSTLGLLLVVSILAIVLFRLSRFILQKYDRRRTREAGWTVLAVAASVLIALSVVGPFGYESSARAEGPRASPIIGNETTAIKPRLEDMPNIILIVMDTVRADHLSSYGYDRTPPTTPRIDEIANEGVLFENAFAEAPWTLPSHASIFTSTFPSDHDTTAEHRVLDDKFETIAEMLRDYLGYQTFGYSNNPFVSTETNLDQGFDTFIMTRFGQAAIFPPLGGTEADGELAELLRLRRYIDRLFQGNDGATDDVVMDDGAEKTNEVVEGWIADALDEEEPFFIFINYMEAHAPYHAPRQYSDPYLPDNVSSSRAQMVNQDSATYIAEAVYMSEEDFAILNALYDGEIAYLDYRIGELYDYLEELDILDDTVLIICSDHGDNLGDHNLLGHQLSINDTLLHVALIIRYPDKFEAGLRVEEQVQLTDLFPTITDTIGYYPDYAARGIRGYSLLRLLKNPKSTPAFAEYEIFATVLENLRKVDPECDTSKYARRLKSVRDGDFKYIWSSDGRDELYNIREDPGELNNIIESEPEKESELRSLLSEQLPGFEP